MKLRKNKKGFSLVELMIVVVIMGILISVAVPLYGSIVRKSEQTACQANQDTIKTVFTKWMLEDEKNTTNSLFSNESKIFDGSVDTPEEIFPESYINDFEDGRLPDCPSDDHHYVIRKVDAERIEVECVADNADADDLDHNPDD